LEQIAAQQATGVGVEMERNKPVDFRPFQFQNEEQLQQSAKSPVFKDYGIANRVIADREKQYEDSDVKYGEKEDGKFGIIQKAEGDNQNATIAEFDTEGQMLANTDRRSAAPSGLIMPFKDAETDFNKMSPDQQQAAIQGGSGSQLKEEPIKQKEKIPVIPLGMGGAGQKLINYGIDIWNQMKRGFRQGEAINQVKQGDLADAANGDQTALN
jgi:hypothetical protein